MQRITQLVFQNGPSHTEIKITKDGPKVVELGARLGGDKYYDLSYASFHRCRIWLKVVYELQLGETADLEPKFHKASAIRYFRVEARFHQRYQGT